MFLGGNFNITKPQTIKTNPVKTGIINKGATKDSICINLVKKTSNLWVFL